LNSLCQYDTAVIAGASEAIQCADKADWIALSLPPLAMTRAQFRQ
jgi:hypothetical protein